MRQDLLFKNLLKKALQDWPEEIFFGNLIKYAEGRFTVEDLYDLSESIEHRYINHPHEVLMRDLHGCIYGVVKAIAEHAMRIKVADIRVEAVKEKFETGLKNEKLMKDPAHFNWRQQDINLVKEYFAVNYPEQENPWENVKISNG